MTQQELRDHIAEYFLTKHPSSTEEGAQRMRDIATAQALAWIESLVFFLRERNEVFLPSRIDVYKEVERVDES